jgi:hypothetical protein
MESKARLQKIHAKRSAFRCHGICLNSKNLKQITHSIRRGKSEFIEKRSNRVTEWKVVFRDITLRLLYDKNRGQVIKFLPHLN